MIVLRECVRLINGGYVESKANGRHKAPITFGNNKHVQERKCNCRSEHSAANDICKVIVAVPKY